MKSSSQHTALFSHTLPNALDLMPKVHLTGEGNTVIYLVEFIKIKNLTQSTAFLGLQNSAERNKPIQCLH